jgi:hypothetical protein
MATAGHHDDLNLGPQAGFDRLRTERRYLTVRASEKTATGAEQGSIHVNVCAAHMIEGSHRAYHHQREHRPYDRALERAA